MYVDMAQQAVHSYVSPKPPGQPQSSQPSYTNLWMIMIKLIFYIFISFISRVRKHSFKFRVRTYNRIVTKSRKKMSSAQRIDDLLYKLSVYRHEQESRLLSPAAVNLKRSTPQLTKMILNNKNNKESAEFLALVEKNILIVATVVTPDCWPLALGQIWFIYRGFYWIFRS